MTFRAAALANPSFADQETRRRAYEKQPREMPAFEFENWAVIALARHPE